jgi:WD40 repeat protein
MRRTLFLATVSFLIGVDQGDVRAQRSEKPATRREQADDAAGSEVHSFGIEGLYVRSLAYSRDGRLLAVGKQENPLVLFDVKSTSRIVELRPDYAGGNKEDGDWVTSCAFVPDGSKVLAGRDRSGVIHVFELSKNHQLNMWGRFTGHTDTVRCMTVSNDGKFALSGSGGRDCHFRYWRIESGKESKQLYQSDRFSANAKACFISADGRSAMVTDGDRLLFIDLADKPDKSVTGHIRLIGIPARKDDDQGWATFSADGQLVAASDGQRDVRIWELRDGKLRDGAREEGNRIDVAEDQSVGAFTPDGTRLVTAGAGAGLNIWDVRNPGTPTRIGQIPRAGGGVVATSPDNKHVAVPSMTTSDQGLDAKKPGSLQIFRLHAVK